MTEHLLRTPLFAQHLALNAKMAPFGGWEMPIQYDSIVNEHLAVRTDCGVFDVSHMGEFIIHGPQALEFLQFITVNDVSKIKIGRAQYNMLPNKAGGLVDDIYLYRLGEDRFLMVVNASNIDKDWNHINIFAKDFDVKFENQSENWALLALQGPKAANLLQPNLTNDLEKKTKNSVFHDSLFGIDVMLARTGYTGEDGFEIFCQKDDSIKLWQELIKLGAKPAGLGARDTLRLEAGFPLYGHEFTDETNPLSTSFAWAVKTYKDFLGKDTMTTGEIKQKLVGLQLDKGIPREGYAVKHNNHQIGRVTSGTMSPILKVGIALAYIDTLDLQTVQVEIRGNDMEAKIVDLPFIKKA